MNRIFKTEDRITASYFDSDNRFFLLGTVEDSNKTIDQKCSLIVFDLTLNFTIKNMKILYRSSSYIRSIKRLDEENIIALLYSGNIIILSRDSEWKIKLLSNDIDKKIYHSFRLVILSKYQFLVSKTYGMIEKYSKLSDNSANWLTEQVNFDIHKNAIFCLNKLDENTFLSSDFKGYTAIWRYNIDNTISVLQSMKLTGNMQDATISHDGKKLAIINRNGSFVYFERNSNPSQEFIKIFENQYPLGIGTKISFLNEEHCLFIATDAMLYKYDLAQNIIFRFKEAEINCVDICLDNNSIIVTCNKEIIIITKDEINNLTTDLQEYKYLKVGLIGHTGVGKSTLCNYIINSNKEEPPSTIYKKLWIWNNPSNDRSHEKIIFHDIAGQQELNISLFPLIVDSDIILALFQTQDSSTFEQLKKSLLLLRNYFKFEKEIILIRTHSNQTNNLVLPNQIKSLQNQCDSHYLFETDINDDNSIMELKNYLAKDVVWQNSHIMKLSAISEILIEFFDQLFLTQYPISDVDFLLRILDNLPTTSNLYKSIQQNGIDKISKASLKHMLNIYKSENLIDYDSENEVLIINNRIFNELRMQIPANIRMQKGIMKYGDYLKIFNSMIQKYEEKRELHETIDYKAEIRFSDLYIKMIDRSYIDNQIVVREDEEKRIFWSYLLDESISLPNNIIDILFNNQNSEEGKIHFMENPFEFISLNDFAFLGFLISLGFCSVSLSKNSGLFVSIDKKKYLYYYFSENVYRGKKNYELGYYITCNDLIENYFIENKILQYIELQYRRVIHKIEAQLLTSHRNSTIHIEKVLLCVAMPYGQRYIKSDQDKRILKKINDIYNHGEIDIKIPDESKCQIFEDNEIKNFNPEIFQFSGHGIYPESKDCFLLFVNEEGEKESVNKEEFVKLVKKISRNLKLVILNACQSYEIGKYLYAELQIPVICYRNDIDDDSALAFTQGFFAALIKYKYDIKSAFDFGCEYSARFYGESIKYLINYIDQVESQ